MKKIRLFISLLPILAVINVEANISDPCLFRIVKKLEGQEPSYIYIFGEHPCVSVQELPEPCLRYIDGCSEAITLSLPFGLWNRSDFERLHLLCQEEQRNWPEEMKSKDILASMETRILSELRKANIHDLEVREIRPWAAYIGYISLLALDRNPKDTKSYLTEKGKSVTEHRLPGMGQLMVCEEVDKLLTPAILSERLQESHVKIMEEIYGSAESYKTGRFVEGNSSGSPAFDSWQVYCRSLSSGFTSNLLSSKADTLCFVSSNYLFGYDGILISCRSNGYTVEKANANGEFLPYQAIELCQTMRNVPVWEATKDGRSFLLFGSAHVVPYDAVPLKVQKLLEASSAIFTECGIRRNPTDLCELAREKGLLSTEGDFDSRFSDRVKALPNYAFIKSRTQKLCSHGGIDINHCTPKFLSLMMPFFEQPPYGIDLQIGSIFSKKGKPVFALETLKDFATAYDRIIREQVSDDDIYNQFIGNSAVINIDTLFLIEAYRAGNLNTVLDISDKATTSVPGLKIGIIERNQKWSQKLLSYHNTMDPNSTTSIVVGMRHLIGEDNLITILQQNGFVIEKTVYNVSQ